MSNQYQKSNLKIFTSFEDENEATARLNASLTPEENFKIAHKMICAMYEKELKKEGRSHYNITFTTIDEHSI
ncbi:MAG: hypothetical protein B6D64_07370 [Bacteroidetes bacterium 4484_276]|nr:MAG: hypothetical protein B6D64_07370 [Bacteroidetes bacterium 4484_276]